MSAGKHYLLIDQGTGSIRVALAASDGAILGMRAFRNRYARDDICEDAQTFSPKEWERNILHGCEELCAEFPDIRVDAVSAAATRQSLILVDREGEAFCGLPNTDNRAAAWLGEIREPEKVYRLSGKWVTEDFGAPKLLALRRQRPEIYTRIHKLLSVCGWVAWMFTGQWAMEPSQACEMQLYDVEKRDWSETLCRFYGADPAILPPLVCAGTVVGEVLPEYRRRFHMADHAVFIQGGADTQIALRQFDFRMGDVALVAGTTSPVVEACSQPLYDPLQRIWIDMGLGGENYQLEANPGVTGLNYQHIKDSLCGDLSYEDLEALYAEKTDFLCTASFSSLLFHERRPLRRGGFFMRAPLRTGPDRTDLLWAVLADIACSISEQLESLTGLTGNRSDCLLGCGGSLRSPTLCQMIADLSGRELKLKNGFEQATLAGLIRLCSEGLHSSADEARSFERSYHPRNAQLIHQYCPVWLENRNRANRPD